MKINEIKAKSILTRSGFPEDDYCINPYSGCSFGCSYCYAVFMRRFTGHLNDKWGEYVDVKMNAPELLSKELELLKKRVSNKKEKAYPSIVIGSVTDPYQGIEAKYNITRNCLKAISKSGVKASFNILTKSHLVTRDIKILKKINKISIGFTITTTSDKISRIFEGNSPAASTRLESLKKLNDENISTYVCINPLLPHYSANEKQLRMLFEAISKTGNKEIWIEHLNLRGSMYKNVINIIRKNDPSKEKYFEKAKTDNYKMKLNRMIFKILDDYNFSLGGGGIIDHTLKTFTSKKKIHKKSPKGWKYIQL